MNIKNWLWVPLIMLLVSCSKQDIIQEPIDEAMWLQRDRGVVVASEFSCSFFVVQTNRGYSVLRMWGGAAPYRGSVLYGEVNRWGISTFYNRSGGNLLRADVRDIGLSYWHASEELNWQCRDDFP